MSSHYELEPAAYERTRAGHLHRRRVEVVVNAADRFVPRGGVVVEPGCGPGAILADVAARRPDARFVGVDLEEAMVRYARAAHPGENLRFERGEVGAEPLPPAHLVFVVDVLHHVHDPEPFAAAVSAALEPGGRFLAIEPNSLHPAIWLKQERMRRARLDEDHFRRRRWRAALGSAGLVVEDTRYLHAFPGGVDVPPLLARVERVVERAAPLAGSVVLLARRTTAD